MDLAQKVFRAAEYLKFGTEIEDKDWLLNVKAVQTAFLYLELLKITPFGEREAFEKIWLKNSETTTDKNINTHIKNLQTEITEKLKASGNDTIISIKQLEDEMAILREDLRIKNNVIAKAEEEEKQYKDDAEKLLEDIAKLTAENNILVKKIEYVEV